MRNSLDLSDQILFFIFLFPKLSTLDVNATYDSMDLIEIYTITNLLVP